MSMTQVHFTETLASHSVLPVRQLEGKEWEVVLIQPGWSKNGRYYPRDVLRKSTPLFEGLSAMCFGFGDKTDHLPDEIRAKSPNGLIANKIGWYESVRYGEIELRSGEKVEGIIGKLHVLEGAKWLRENLRDAFNHGHLDLFQLSIDARGKARLGEADGRRGMIVETIEEVTSTDLVSQAAAGGQLVKMVASATQEKPMSLFETLRKGAPHFLVGFSEAEAEGESFLVRVLETNLARAEEELGKINPEETTVLAEVARGVDMLRKALKMAEDGDADGAMKLVKSYMTAMAGDMEESVRPVYAYPKEKKQAQHQAPVEEPELAPITESEGSMADTLPKEASPQATDVAVKEAELKKRENLLFVKERVLESDLPKQSKDRVIEILSAKESIDAEAIDLAITKEREYIKSFTESRSEVKGLGDANTDSPMKPKVKVTQEQIEKYDRAWDGFFDGSGQLTEGVAPFTSLFQALKTITGVRDDNETMARLAMEGIACAVPSHENSIMEDFVPQLRESWNHRQNFMSQTFRESITTSDFSVSFGSALFRRTQKEYRDPALNDWRNIISSVENLQDATSTYYISRTGGLSTLATVAQGGPYQEFTDNTEVSESFTPTKYGNLYKLTWEALLADRASVIRDIPKKLGRSAARTIHENVWNQIDLNTSIQGNNLISSANANYLAASALSYANLNKLSVLLMNQTEQDSSKKLGLQPKYLLVSPTLKIAATELTDSSVKSVAAEDATIINAIGKMGVQTFPTIGLGRDSNAYYYYLMADPRDAETIAVGFLGGRDRPDIFVQSPTSTPTSGASFDADQLTFKIRLVFGSVLVDWRWITGSPATS